jgi:ferredoxin-NADP reductase
MHSNLAQSTGRSSRVNFGLLAMTRFPVSRPPDIYVCGPTSFVESAFGSLVELGFDALHIKTERFGASGG